MKDEAYFIGIDLGSQGLRVVVTDISGNIISFAETTMVLTKALRQQQDPSAWWGGCIDCLTKSIAHLSTRVKQKIIAIGVTSTSGTVIPLDKNYNPLYDAIMYSDARSAEEATRCTSVAKASVKNGFTNFNSSTGLAKMVWFANRYPDKAASLYLWIHASDFITGKLCGTYDVTDYTNVLKSGYDLSELIWPDYIFEKKLLEKQWMQKVVPPGTVIGTLGKDIAQLLGLLKGVKVCAGITDGCASQVASGAMLPGQWNTTIGTTLVIKGVTSKAINDPAGRIYNHRHPQGFWMPGGAGNIGADWVSKEYATDIATLNNAAKSIIPTGQNAYPLLQQGERFPFIAPLAKGFEPEGLNRATSFAAKMEGVAYVERYAYELIRYLSDERVDAVYTAGGASNSEVWLQIRSSVLNRPVFKMKHGSGAVGAAIVASSQTYFDTLSDAAANMVQLEKVITPDKNLTEKYSEYYFNFIEALKIRKFIGENIYA